MTMRPLLASLLFAAACGPLPAADPCVTPGEMIDSITARHGGAYIACFQDVPGEFVLAWAAASCEGQTARLCVWHDSNDGHALRYVHGCKEPQGTCQYYEQPAGATQP